MCFEEIFIIVRSMRNRQIKTKRPRIMSARTKQIIINILRNGHYVFFRSFVSLFAHSVIGRVCVCAFFFFSHIIRFDWFCFTFCLIRNLLIILSLSAIRAVVCMCLLAFLSVRLKIYDITLVGNNI